METNPTEIPLEQVSSAPMGQTQVNPASAAFDAVNKRRGRHKKDCPCDKCASRRLSLNQSPSEISKQTLTDAEKKLATETCTAFTHVADTIALWKFRQNIGFLPENQQRHILSKVPMSESLRKGIGETGAVVAEKHGIAKNLPELALCSYLAAYVTGLSMLAMDVKNYAQEYAKLKKESEKNPSNGPERERKE